MKIVHINQLQHRIQPSSNPSLTQPVSKPVIQWWCLPQVEYSVEPESNTPHDAHEAEPETTTPHFRQSARHTRPPDYHHPDACGCA